VTTHRERVLDAAIELLGTQGLRATTHLRVDERAGLARGSTSNYFRTRAALLQGIVEHMVSRELPAVDSAVAPKSVDEFIDGVAQLFEFMTGPNRVMTTARLNLLMEASHNAELRAALIRGRQVMEHAILPTLAALGAPRPLLAAQAFAACFEGLFLDRIARHADIDPRPVLDLVVRAALQPR
jgi:AcrR family transcriptional regulator